MKKNIFKERKGITLIALVITIIVLLILAGVALSLVLGENGITERAVNAGKVQNMAGAKEKLELEVANLASEFYQAKYVNGSLPDGIDTIQKYIMYKLNNVSSIGDYSLSISGTSATLTATKGSDRTTATAEIDGNGKVIWGGTSTASAVSVAITVDTEDSSKGTVDTTVNGTYQGGTKIALTATPASGYKLDGWYIGNAKQTLDSEGKYTVPSSGTSVALVARFVEKTNIAVGSTVTYYPAGATYTWMGKYATTAELTGNTTTDDVELNSNVSGNYRITSWKVLSYDESTGMVEMVPASQPSTTVKLQGANGYNNGVKLLNDACKTLFVNSSAGITADDVRSINVEDIENAMKDTAITTAKHFTYTFLNSEDQVSTPYTVLKYYPLIYAQENNSEINENKNTSGWGLSRQDSLIERGDTVNEPQTSGSDSATTTKTGTNGYVQATTSIRPYQTYYEMSLFGSSNVKTPAHWTVLSLGNKQYWVASRCVNTDSSICRFCVCFVFEEQLKGRNYVPLERQR